MKLYRNLAAASLTVLAFASQAHAQEAAPAPAPTATPAAAATSVGEIVVTARRREERLQDVPLTVAAVTADTLNRDQIRDFSDVASLVPGLSLTPASDGISPSATLRGVNYNVNASGSNGTVDFYLNDAPITAGALFQAMFDVSQIEVLYGPQGTLRGLASPSGSVTVNTTRPDLYRYGGYVDGTVANADSQNLNGAVNVPLIEGVLAVRVAGLVSNNEANQVRSKNDPDFTPYDHTSGERITVRFDPISTLDIQGSYQHLKTDQSYFDQVESAGLVTGAAVQDTLITAKNRESVESSPRLIHGEYDIFNLQAEWKFAGQRLNYVGSWDNTKVASKYSGDDGAYFIDSGAYPGNANASAVTSPNIYNYGADTGSRDVSYSQELRLSSDHRLFGMLNYVVGALVNHQNAPTDLVEATPQFRAAPLSPATYYGISVMPDALMTRTMERSIYGNLNLQVAKDTEISGGLRNIDFHNYSSLDIVDPNGEARFNATIYSASVKHRFNDNIMAYASTGTSWRIGAGTTGTILRGSGQYGAVTDPALEALYGFKPETSTSYELGLKTDWLEKKLLFNIDIYKQDFKNFIYNTAGDVYVNTNSGTAAAPHYTSRFTAGPLADGVPVTVDGVETEVAYRFSSRFKVDATLSYSKSKIENGQVPCTLFDGSGAAIAPVLPKQINFCSANYSAGLSPPFSATVQSEYSHPVGPYDGFVRGLLSYYGHSQNDPTNPYDDVKAYALVNGYVGLRDPGGRWELTGYVKNLFNTQRVLSRAEAVNADAYYLVSGTGAIAGGGSVNTNYRAITMTAPQEFGVNLHVSFGAH